MHAQVAARLQLRAYLVRLALADQRADRRRRVHHLGRRDTPVPARLRQQRLHDHRPQRGRDLHADLLLLILRVHVDQTVHRRARVLRVQGREHQVAGLHRRQRGADRLQVTQLADHDDVRVLTQRVLERLRETQRVRADLTLADHAVLVPVHELDRVLDRDDMVVPLRVRLVHDRGQRGRLARTRRPAHQHQAARQERQVRDPLVQAQLGDRLDLQRDRTQRRAHAVTILVHVHTEPDQVTDRERHIQLELLLEPLQLLIRRHHLHRSQRPLLIPDGRVRRGDKLAVHAEHRVIAHDQVKIGRVEGHELTYRVDELRVGIGVLGV